MGGGVTFPFACSTLGVFSLMALSVMSVSGVPCLEDGSGEAVAFGVGSGGWSSGASDAIDTRETLLFRAARASLALRLLGGDFLVGDVGSSATLSGGLNT